MEILTFFPLGDNSLWVLGVSACLASRGANSCVSDHLFKGTAFKLSVVSPPEQRAACLQSWTERVFSSREKSRSAYCLWRKVQLHKAWGSSLATQLTMYTGIMNVHGRGIKAFRIKGKMRVFPRGPVAASVLPWVVRELDPTCHSLKRSYVPQLRLPCPAVRIEDPECCGWDQLQPNKYEY